MKLCLQCNESFKFARQEQKFCSHSCASISRKGVSMINSGQFKKGIHPKTQFKKGQHVAHKNGCQCFRCEKRTGENHHNWKGGFRSRFYNEYMVVAVAKRRTLKMKNGGTHTLEQWQELKKKYNYMCLCCKKQEPLVKLTEDHILPLSIGGSNDISNIQPLCRSCNARKHTQVTNYITLTK